MEGDERHHRRLEAMFASAPINGLYRPAIDISSGRAVVRMEVDPRFFHPVGALHGSVVFKALDDAAFFAASSLDSEHFVLTVSFHVHFMRPAESGVLSTEGRVVRRSARLTFADAIVYGSAGEEIARGTGTFMPSRIRLDSVDGYAGALDPGRDEPPGP